jgi:hypothetical protein
MLTLHSRLVHEATIKAGGSTFEPLYGRFVTDRDGHCVSLLEGSALRVARDQETAARLRASRGEKLEVFGPHHVERVVRAHQHLYSAPGTTIGTWVDGHGVVHIDPAEIVPDLAEALRRASERNQKAVYDLSRGLAVPVSGPVAA